jgi:hypothetical protein
MFLYTYRKPFWDGYSLPSLLECSGGIISIGDTKIDIAAKRHKIHKKNILYIGISNSYGSKKHKFGLFTRALKFITKAETIN